MEGQAAARTGELIENTTQTTHANARERSSATRSKRPSPRDLRREAAMESFLTTIAAGYSITLAAKKAEVERKTLYRWRDEYPEFADRWDEATTAGLDTVEDLIRAQAPKDWRAAQAILEAQANGGWGKRPAGTTVNVNSSTNIVAAEASVTVPGPDIAWLSELLDGGRTQAEDTLPGEERPVLPAGLPAAAA